TNPSGATSGGVPTNASAVVLNVTVTNTTATSYLTAYPAGLTSPPIVSDLNWTQGDTVPNLVVVNVSSSGQVAFYNSLGSTDLIVDVLGYYVGGGTLSQDPLSVTTTTLPQATVNQSYSTTLAASGGSGSYSWSVTGLPAGLLISTSGVISGIPTTAGTSTVSIKVTDSAEISSTVSLSLVTNPPISITTTSLPSATSNQAYSTTLSATGGDGGYTWSATGLPAGLSMSTSGVISGTAGYAGTASLAITVADASAQSTTTNLSLVTNPQFSTSNSPNWSGYAALSGPFDGVSATFNVASLTSPQPSICNQGTTDTLSQYCAMSEWVGIDGASNSDLIQAGIEETPIVGTNEFSIQPWWEILPASQTDITSIQVSAGDSVTVDIFATSTADLWGIEVLDNTNDESFTTYQYYYGPGTSAEWIVEATQINGVVSTLSPYSPVTFTNPEYNLAPSGGVDQQTEVFMVQNGSVVSSPSNISNNSFTVSYG
ncbi:G1 family glutamic endopeptidase, partial [Ferrimicrobium sp.]